MSNKQIELISEFEKLKQNLICKDCDNPGKQGIVKIINLNGNNYIIKLSKYIDNLIKHEYSVLNGLLDLKNFCPHFCEVYGKITTKVDKLYRKAKNPFKILNKYPIYQDVILMEYIKGKDFHHFMKNKNNKDSHILSVIKQTMLALSMAQKEKKFVHYDIHPSNILMKKCDPDDVYLYVIDENIQFCVPTYGNYPIIIDVGFGYIEDNENKPIHCTLAHTNYGFTSCLYDEISDPKLFMVTSSDVYDHYRENDKSKALKSIVKNIFSSLKIEMTTGWDKTKGSYSTLDFIRIILKDKYYGSELFKNQSHFCIELIQVLIDLPIKEKDIDECQQNLKLSYKTMIKEFLILEDEIGSSFYSLYIFKNIVDAIKPIKNKYKSVKTRQEAITIFKNNLFDILNQVSKFCVPKNLNYEKLLCSIIAFSQSMEGIIYYILNSQIKEKKKQYKKMELKNIDQIYCAIDANLPCEYKYTKNTTIHIWDRINKIHKTFKIPEKHLKKINKLNTLVCGTYIYDLYTTMNTVKNIPSKSEESDSSDNSDIKKMYEYLKKENIIEVSEETKKIENLKDSEDSEKSEEKSEEKEDSIESEKSEDKSEEKEDSIESEKSEDKSEEKENSIESEKSEDKSEEKENSIESDKLEDKSEEKENSIESDKSEDKSEEKENSIESEKKEESEKSEEPIKAKKGKKLEEPIKAKKGKKLEEPIKAKKGKKLEEPIKAKKGKKLEESKNKLESKSEKQQCAYIFLKGAKKGTRCENKGFGRLCCQHNK